MPLVVPPTQSDSNMLASRQCSLTTRQRERVTNMERCAARRYISGDGGAKCRSLTNMSARGQERWAQPDTIHHKTADTSRFVGLLIRLRRRERWAQPDARHKETVGLWCKVIKRSPSSATFGNSRTWSFSRVNKFSIGIVHIDC
jgi:hypothetical protein